jgi:hypothetical protein
MAVLLSASLSHAQTTAPEPDRLATYQFDVSVPVKECDYAGDTGGNTDRYPPAGAKFMLIEEIERGGKNLATIQFLHWGSTTENYRTFNVDTNSDPDRPRIFCVDRGIFRRTASRIYEWGWASRDLAAGILLLPIKMRFGGSDRDFDFSKDVTVGTVVGPRFRMSPRRDAYASFLVGAGLTAVTLDSTNTHGVIKQSTDRPAVTLSLGPMVEMNRFQIGAMWGWDFISRSRQSNWRYQGRPWLAIGLGYTILSAPASAPASNNKQK